MNPSSFLFKTALALLAFCLFTNGESQIDRQSMVVWRTYHRGLMSGAKQTETYVFETEGQFQNYWSKVIGPIGGKMPTGGIDWSREKLVAVNLGSRPNPGYEIVVASMKRVRSAEILVTFQEKLPIPGMNYPQMTISPFVIVKMDRIPGLITFKGETVKSNIGIIKGQGNCCGDVCRCCENCGCGCQHGGGKDHK
ncbi:MAG: protease complex subunit PrcB family protein [Fimbriimonadaceae bacterium]|nr:protease complex subunit PrcB family protein [Fimbriimonadaceae bacterium]